MKNNLIVRDKKWRSMAKAASWRMTGTVDTILISWLITHKLHIALSIGFVELFTKLALYYFHERAWERVKIGRVTADYEI
jgi:uncharacterized membrane protein